MIFLVPNHNLPIAKRGKAAKFFDLQMGRIGAFGLRMFKDRVARGIGVNDAPMKPLVRGYAIQKTRKGQGNRRNLRSSGAMLDNLTIRSATEKQVRIAFTRKLERQKALANQQKSPFMPWSDNDTRAIFEKATDIWRTEVTVDVAKSLGPSKARALRRLG